VERGEEDTELHATMGHAGVLPDTFGTMVARWRRIAKSGWVMAG
jgi:hypothetical protein